MSGQRSILFLLFFTTYKQLQTTQEALEGVEVLLSTNNISECLRHNEELKLEPSVDHVLLTYNYSPSDMNNNASSEESTCKIIMQRRLSGLTFSVLVLEQSCVTDNEVNVQGYFFNSHTWDGCERWVAPGLEHVTIYSSRWTQVATTITVGNWSAPFRLRLSMRTIPKPPYLGNHLRYVSESLGYIESYQFDPAIIQAVQRSVDSWTQVDVPKGHVTMISIAHVAIPTDKYCSKYRYLSLHAGSTNNTVWRVCQDRRVKPGPVLLNTSVFHVHFKRRETYQIDYKFRILFSFHQISAAPEKVSRGLWNCSSPAYQDFKLHLLCNLKTECAGGEDESSCRYSPCDHSGVAVAGRCFFLSPTGVYSNTWYNASAWCASQGGRLASLNSPEKMTSVVMYLRLDWYQDIRFNVGLTTSSSKLPLMYKKIMQWQDSTVAYYLDYMPDGGPPQCGVMTVKDGFSGKKVGHVRMGTCLNVAVTMWSYTLCQKPMAESGQTMTTTVRRPLPQFPEVALTTLQNQTDSDLFVVCPRGHLVHSFLACDPSSACFAADDIGFSSHRESWALPSYSSCGVNMTSLPPSFTCANGADHVPYTLVCDHRRDCLDNSDEDFCVYPPCNVTWQFQCRSHQCHPVTGKCDGNADCHDHTDEDRCGTEGMVKRRIFAMRPPSLVTIDGSGSCIVSGLLTTTTSCPQTHFKCSSIGYCVPVFLRCNGVNDCPEKEDEEDCGAKSSECPGYYRCRGVLDTCLHPDHVCDGWPQCPQMDDELFCNSTCPAECVCLGHSFVCRQSFQADSYPEVRFLDAEASGMKPAALRANVLLIHLSLANCDLTHFGNITLQNLHSLDLHGNRIRAVSDVHLVGLSKLETLFLSANPLTSLFASQSKHGLSSTRLTRLDFSYVQIHSFDPRVLSRFPDLQTLNLSGCGIHSVTSPARFNLVSKLRVLDVRGCPLYLFPTGMLKPLNRLRTVHADNYKLCCRANLPDRFLSNRECEAPRDKIASCKDLFKSNAHRLSWYASTSVSLLGNIAALATRIILNRTSRQSRAGGSGQQSVDVFVSSLFVCGCVHAVYMAVISIADAVFQGSYVLKDTSWRGSVLCTSAGFLWLLSSELSLLLVCLITIDRVLVLWCPCTSWHFSAKSAKVAVVITWVGSTAAALLPLSSDLKWFQQTPLCSPSLLSAEERRGEAFIFGRFSVFNVALSWVLVLGQMLIYVHLRRHALAFVHSPDKTKELSTSRRVMMLVVCDVILWLVIGHGSHLAASGMYMSDDVVAAAQVMVMPLNWTLKPLLHVFGTLLERRRTEREERMLKILMAKSQR